MTEALIDRLARDLRPAGPVVRARLGLAIVSGAVAALAGVVLLLGFRPDMSQALGTGIFWMKLLYPGACSALALWSVERLARPGGLAGARLAWLPVAVAPVLLMAAMASLRAPAAGARQLVMGETAMACPWLIAATAAPLFLPLVLAVRSLAPTRLRLAGATTGLAAGGAAAAIYALHCGEAGVPFLAIWYSLGMLIPCAAGALAGPRLLRW